MHTEVIAERLERDPDQPIFIFKEGEPLERFAMSLREAEQQRRQNERDRAVDDLRVLTIPQAAEISGMSKWTLERLIKAGKGPIITQISDRRKGITVGNLRRWQKSRERA